MGSSGHSRAFPRKEIQLGILFKQGMEWYPATIRDLSEGGLSFETDIEFKLGDMCHIYFSESKEVTSTELTGQVARIEEIKGCSPPQFLVAVDLKDAAGQYVRDVKAIFQVEDPAPN